MVGEEKVSRKLWEIVRKIWEGEGFPKIASLATKVSLALHLGSAAIRN